MLSTKAAPVQRQVTLASGQKGYSFHPEMVQAKLTQCKTDGRKFNSDGRQTIIIGYSHSDAGIQEGIVVTNSIGCVKDTTLQKCSFGPRCNFSHFPLGSVISGLPRDPASALIGSVRADHAITLGDHLVWRPDQLRIINSMNTEFEDAAQLRFDIASAAEKAREGRALRIAALNKATESLKRKAAAISTVTEAVTYEEPLEQPRAPRVTAFDDDTSSPPSSPEPVTTVKLEGGYDNESGYGAGAASGTDIGAGAGGQPDDGTGGTDDEGDDDADAEAEATAGEPPGEVDPTSVLAAMD
jgi:hypothetical protein